MTARPTLQACLVALALAAPLAACGKMGRLEQPGPLFGKTPTAAAEAKEAREVKREEVPPIETIDRRDPDLAPFPERNAPIEGTEGPNALPPPGALPNPYATPPK
jgi:predicted small lipoprotein YifL